MAFKIIELNQYYHTEVCNSISKSCMEYNKNVHSYQMGTLEIYTLASVSLDAVWLSSCFQGSVDV